MRSYWEIIGQAIREARQETEESQRSTALRLDMKPSDYAKTEDGELSPDFVLETLMWALVERDEALQWKKEMLLVDSQWDEQAVGRLLGLQLGEPIKANIEPKLRQIMRERDEAREQAARWEAVALREASINGARIFGKEAAK